MRILVVNTNSPQHSTGGAQLSAAELASDLVALGHDVVFASLTSDVEAAADETNAGIRFTQVLASSPRSDHRNLRGFRRALRRGRREWYFRFATFGVSNIRAVGRLLDEECPDLIVTNVLRGWSTSIWWQAERHGVPVVHLIHEYDLLCPTGLMHEGTPCDGSRLTCRLRSLGARLSGRKVIPWGVSETVLREHQSRGVFASSPLRAFYPRIEEQPAGITNGSPLSIGYLGRASPEKGLDVLGRAAAVAGVTVDVGAPLNDHLREMESMFPGVFTLHGPVVPSAFLRRLEVLVVPSAWKEPLGRIVFEAALAGTPVVVSDAPGLVEAATASGARYLSFPRGDAECLANVLRSVMDGTAEWALGAPQSPPGDVRDLLASAGLE